jgi:hypothetical protein
MCALSGFALIGIFFVKKINLDRQLRSEQGLRNSEKTTNDGPIEKILPMKGEIVSTV